MDVTRQISGTTADRGANGQAEGVVAATGNRTETGRIARLIHEAADLSTPLTRKIAQFSKEPDVPQRLLSLPTPADFMALLEEKKI